MTRGSLNEHVTTAHLEYNIFRKEDMDSTLAATKSQKTYREKGIHKEKRYLSYEIHRVSLLLRFTEWFVMFNLLQMRIRKLVSLNLEVKEMEIHSWIHSWTWLTI